MIPGLEAQYRQQLLQAKLFRSVVGDVFISDPALWERYRDEREQVKIGLAKIDPAVNVTDEAATVTPDEARSYYDAHPDEFKQPESAYLSYVSIPRVPLASDTAAALDRAESLRTEIEGGTPFDEVARRESADTVSGAEGGDLGEMGKSQVVPAFADAVAKLPLNSLSQPVLTQFGFHLIKVESRKADSFHARHILIPIEVTGEHRDKLDAEADSLETLAAEKLDRAAIDTAARALGLTIHQVGPVTKGARVFVPGAGFVPDAGTWAFQAQPDEQSPVVESPTAFYVFRLDSLHQEGVPAFEAIKTEVEQKVKLSKKLAKARELGEQLAKAAAGSSLEQASKTMGFGYQVLGPFARLTAPLPDPALIGASFGLRQGAVSPPIEVDGSGPGAAGPAVYVIQQLQHLPADSADFAKNLPSIRAQALQTARRSRVQSYVTALRDKAKVADYRNEVYKTAAQNAQTSAAQF